MQSTIYIHSVVHSFIWKTRHIYVENMCAIGGNCLVVHLLGHIYIYIRKQHIEHHHSNKCEAKKDYVWKSWLDTRYEQWARPVAFHGKNSQSHIRVYTHKYTKNHEYSLEWDSHIYIPCEFSPPIQTPHRIDGFIHVQSLRVGRCCLSEYALAFFSFMDWLLCVSYTDRARCLMFECETRGVWWLVQAEGWCLRLVWWAEKKVMFVSMASVIVGHSRQ